MLLVTQHVFSGGDDSQRPWSDRYFSTKRVCFFDHREARSRDDDDRASDLAQPLEPERAHAKDQDQDQDQDLARVTSQQLYELWKSGVNPAATLEMALRYVGLSPSSPPLLVRSSNSKLTPTRSRDRAPDT